MTRWALVVVLLARVAAAQRLELVPQTGHTWVVRAVAISRDGQRALSGADDGELMLWDLPRGVLVRAIPAAQAQISALAISPDGGRALSGGRGGMKLWDLASGKLLRDFVQPGLVSAVAFLPDGKRALSVGNGRRSWDLATGGQLGHIAGDVSGLAVAPDGRHALVGQGKQLVIWDLSGGPDVALPGRTGDVSAIAYSVEGTRVVSASDQEIVTWDPNGWTVASAFARKGGVSAVAMAGGQIIVGGWDGRVELWEPGGKLAHGELAHDRLQVVMALAPDGQHVVTGGYDHTVKLWRRDGLRLEHTFASWAEPVLAVASSPDGKRAMAAQGNLVRLWDLTTGALISSFAGHPDQVHAVGFTPDGKYGVSAGRDKRVRLWELASGAEVRVFTGAYDEVATLAVSPDGRLLAGGDFLGFLDIWEVASGKHLQQLRTYATGEQLAWLPDGKRLLATAGPYDVALYDAASGQELSRFTSEAAVNGLALSPDGKLLALALNRRAPELWDLAAGKRLVRLGPRRAEQPGWQPSSTSVAFALDGRQLVSGSDDGTVSLWSVPSGRLKRRLVGHRRAVNAVTMAGGHAVSGSTDGTLRLWNLATGGSIALAAAGAEWLIYDDDGRFDASRRGGDLVAAVQGLDVYRIDQLAVANNRPDLLLVEAGIGTPELIQHYRARHDQRVKKLGLGPAGLATRFVALPTAAILGVTRDGAAVRVRLRLVGGGTPLAAYDVYVNDVPLYGTRGKPVSGASATVEERVDLVPGQNRIEVGARNAAGAESLRAFYEVPDDRAAKGDLYFLGFGISHYRDARLDLGWAAKDALDLGQVFAAEKGAYAAVHTTVLTDAQVTVAALTGARAALAKAQPGDTVVVFVAGHGTHARDAAGDYYYVTHETDVARLAETAASFELIEGLLDGLAARRKLLLLDTCESGEADGEPPLPVTARAHARTIRALVLETAAPRKARPWLTDRERLIESSLARRTGAIVLSSSRGTEASYEYDDLQNGAFTWALKQALTTPVADADHDGEVTSTELRSSVAAAVAKLTGGLQHPTVDRDNPALTLHFPIVKPARR